MNKNYNVTDQKIRQNFTSIMTSSEMDLFGLFDLNKCNLSTHPIMSCPKQNETNKQNEYITKV